ncbi:helix-turn-helix transcriptional regulator [Streptomyces cupreus]|uniref:Helix-turn-helix domain-containing protein n=1 Tax=Streptomyces cupreus TaxID=2759956 RepID=A0A7X1J0Y6_9ACTN|nr:LuxR family transcriptional regulator [Streptomyces cupreus]MBC2901609.1 helix-turn-helix domain-containing protein [Streptomyces cupreus]
MTYGTEQPPIIGRQAERRQLAAALDACREACGGALLLTGGHGIGKTTLLRYASHLAHEFRTVRADGVPAEQHLAYGAVQRLVRPLAADIPQLPPQSREVLERLLLGHVPSPGERSLIGVAVLALLAKASGRSPVLVGVDDLHRVDAESRYAIGFVARRISAERVLMLAATERHACAAVSGVPVLRLAGLSDQDCLRLIARIASCPVALPVREVLLHAAGGNPLILLELLRTLTPAELSQVSRLPDPLPLAPRLARLRLAEFRRLPEDCRRLLLLLAAEPGLDPLTFFRVAQRTSIDPSALKPAETAGLLTTSRTAISFRHDDLGRAICQGADPAERHWAHDMLARAFADTHDDRRCWHEAALRSEADADLADELERQAACTHQHGSPAHAAALMERSAQLSHEDGRRGSRLVTAADYSTRAGRPRRAARLLERAETLVGRDQPSLRGRIAYLKGVISLQHAAAPDAYDGLLTAADLLAGDNPSQAVKALVAAGEAGLHAGNAALCAQAGRRALAVLNGSATGEEEPASRLAVDVLLAVADALQGRPATAVPRLRERLGTAARTDDPLLLAWASHGALFIADDARARALAGRAVALARTAGDTPTMVHAMQYLSYPECWLSGPDTATLTATEALRLARETGQLTCVRNLMGMLMLAAGVTGDSGTCGQYADRVVGEAQAHGLGLPSALGLWGLAHLDLASGNWAEAAAKLRRLVRTRLGHPGVAIEAVPSYVEAAVRAGDRPRAERAAAAFAPWAEAVGRGWPTALAARCRALLETGDTEQHFRSALLLHPIGDRELELARTCLLYGEYLNRERRRADARAQLREAADIFRRHGARLWLDRTGAELRATGDDWDPTENEAPAVEGRTGTLTSRQRQIVRLVAQGATNKEVAARLYLSPRTVDYHLRRIFERLGITSRSDLIRRCAADAGSGT